MEEPQWYVHTIQMANIVFPLQSQHVRVMLDGGLDSSAVSRGCIFFIGDVLVVMAMGMRDLWGMPSVDWWLLLLAGVQGLRLAAYLDPLPQDVACLKCPRKE